MSSDADPAALLAEIGRLRRREELLFLAGVCVGLSGFVGAGLTLLLWYLRNGGLSARTPVETFVIVFASFTLGVVIHVLVRWTRSRWVSKTGLLDPVRAMDVPLSDGDRVGGMSLSVKDGSIRGKRRGVYFGRVVFFVIYVVLGAVFGWLFFSNVGLQKPWFTPWVAAVLGVVWLGFSPWVPVRGMKRTFRWSFDAASGEFCIERLGWPWRYRRVRLLLSNTKRVSAGGGGLALFTNDGKRVVLPFGRPQILVELKSSLAGVVAENTLWWIDTERVLRHLGIADKLPDEAWWEPHVTDLREMLTRP